MIINREVLNIKPKLENTVENFNIFQYTLEVASVMNDEISLFTEGFGIEREKKTFNFRAIIEAILDALINAIKKLFRHFLAFLAHLASMGSSFEIELRRFKERIKAFDGKVNISIPYYEYTNISHEYPSFDIYKDIENLIEFYSEKYDKAIKSGGHGAYELTLLEQNLDPKVEQNKFRNRLLGTENKDCSDFVRILHEFFRNNNDTPNNGFTLDGKRIYNDFYVPYIDSRKELSMIKKEQDNVEKNIKLIKGRIKSFYFDISRLEQYEDSLKSQMTQSVFNIERKLCTAIDLISQDILLMYGQKYQAYKEFKTQSKTILVETIKACIVQGG